MELALTLSADTLKILKWYMTASFAVYADFKDHTGSIMSMRKGAIIKFHENKSLSKRAVLLQKLFELMMFQQ